MAKRLLLPLALVLIVAAPALAGDGYGDQKAKVDAKLAHLQSKIAKQDKKIALAVAAAKHRVAAARLETKTIRRGVTQETRVISARTTQQAILRGELLSSRDRLASARSGKSHDLVLTKQQVQDEIDESKALAAASAQLAAKIAQSEAH